MCTDAPVIHNPRDRAHPRSPLLRPELGTAATLGFMLRYLGLFSDSFTLAIILWPFASAVLTLPILAMLYHKDHRLRLAAGLSAYLAVLYALGLVAFTLYPMPDDPAQFCATHHLLPQLDLLKFIQDAQTGLYGVLQLVMNVVFFMPMGFMLCRWAGWRFWVALPFSFGCSVFIETSQLTGFWGLYPCAYRQFDVDDMLTNTLGAVIGFGIAKLIGLVWPKKQIEAGGVVTRPGFVHRAVALIIDVILMQICVFTISIAFMYAFYKLALPLNNGRFTIGAFEVGTELVEWVPRLLAVCAFAVFEVWVPWRHRGQTLGCQYTQMTVEAAPRVGTYRVAFYVTRTAVLGTWYLLLVDGANQPFWWLTFALLVFWLVAKRMPWDIIPAPAASASPERS